MKGLGAVNALLHRAKGGNPRVRDSTAVGPPCGLPQAAGITGALAGAGASENAVAWWFSRARCELDGHSPRSWLLTGRGEGRVLALARQDADALTVE
jgi:hypothetical protein